MMYKELFWCHQYDVYAYPTSLTLQKSEIYLKLIKTPERRHGLIFVNFELVSHIFVVFLLLICTSKCLLDVLI